MPTLVIWTEDMAATVRQMRAELAPIDRVAARVGVSRPVLVRWMRANGLTTDALTRTKPVNRVERQAQR